MNVIIINAVVISEIWIQLGLKSEAEDDTYIRPPPFIEKWDCNRPTEVTYICGVFHNNFPGYRFSDFPGNLCKKNSTRHRKIHRKKCLYSIS